MTEKVSVTKVAAGTVAVVVDRWRSLVKALAVLFVLAVILGWIPTSPEGGVLTGVLLGLQLLIHTLFAVTTHRIVLRGEYQDASWGVPTWSRRETKFVLNLLGLSLVALMMLSVAVSLPAVGALVVVAVVGVVFSSLSLVFPGVAVDDDIDVVKAWELGSGYRALMVATVCLFPMLLATPFVALVVLVPEVARYMAPVFQTLLTVFTVAALSIAYAEINRVKGQA